MGVNNDVSNPSDCVTAGEPKLPQLQARLKDNRDGPEALHCCRLCDICGSACCLYGHRAVPRTFRRAPAHHTGVPDGRQKHELSSSFAVAHRFIPVCCGDHWRTSGNLYPRYSVLVHRLCLHSGPPHSCSCFHSSVVQTATLQRIPGIMESFLFLGWIVYPSQPSVSHVVLFHSILNCASAKLCESVGL